MSVFIFTFLYFGRVSLATLVDHETEVKVGPTNVVEMCLRIKNIPCTDISDVLCFVVFGKNPNLIY